MTYNSFEHIKRAKLASSFNPKLSLQYGESLAVMLLLMRVPIQSFNKVKKEGYEAYRKCYY